LPESVIRALEASAADHPPAPLELAGHHLAQLELPAHTEESAKADPLSASGGGDLPLERDLGPDGNLPPEGDLPPEEGSDRAPGHFEPTPEDLGSPSYQRLGAEGLVRLRARYAEVMARIAERPMDEPVRDELKERAQRLNPDAWVTGDEVTAALEQYETVFEGLRGVVGRHPRGRRRGRR
jgi:hypothetical protein